MAAPVFVEAEYADPPCTGLETREADGSWLGCTAYTHAARGNVVLWYGGETYEGLDGGGYRWGAGGAPPGGEESPQLLDGDGDVVPTRWAVAEGDGGCAQAPACATTAATAAKLSRFLPFGGALAVARSLGLASQFEWQAWSKEGLRPANVPSCPNRVYKDHGWQGWSHWLNSSNLQTRLFLPFEEALVVARSLGLPGRMEWKVWSKEGLRPPNVPSDPSKTYKDHGWQGWGHWLGSSNLQTKLFLPFEEALAVARSLNLASSTEWQVWSRESLRPADVPANPNRVYNDHGWQGWGHWLGSSNHMTKLFLPFDEALDVARSLGLASTKEWRAWCKEGLRPANVPADPGVVYKHHGWQGWGHWLGSSNLQTKLFLPFKEALAVARSLGLPGRMEWMVWSKEGLRPPNVPSDPSKVYKDHGWQGWGHWLGTGNHKNQKKNFLPFDEALRAARQLRLVSHKEWLAWCRSGSRPANVPARPDQIYVHDGWMGWVHWLYHANLGPATVPPAMAPNTRKRSAPGHARSPGGSRGKRRRR